MNNDRFVTYSYRGNYDNPYYRAVCTLCAKTMGSHSGTRLQGAQRLHRETCVSYDLPEDPPCDMADCLDHHGGENVAVS